MWAILELIFGRALRSFDGYKSYIGAVGGILTGVTGLIGHFWPDTGLPAMPLESAYLTISASIYAIGRAHKAQKLIEKSCNG